MKILRSKAIRDRVVRFYLDTGRYIDRDFSLVENGVFTATWGDPKKFREISVAGGDPSWPGGLDFCPDVMLRGGIKGRVPRFAFVGPGCLICATTVATAFHEAGHAVVGYQRAGNVPRRISVIAKSRNLGRTDSHPCLRT
ncbi:MAG: hypothetical protein ACLP66_18570 [Polyangia bacterium]